MTSSRRWTIRALVLVALSVGGNIVLASIASVLWIADSGVEGPEDVVAVFASSGSSAEPRDSPVSFTANGIRRRIVPAGVFAGVTGQVRTDEANSGLVSQLRLAGGRSRPRVAAVTSTYFDVLGVPVLGRAFREEDDQLGAEPVAILSRRYWQRAFGGDSSIIGSVIDATPEPVRIAGVVDGAFEGALRGERVDLWMPHNVSMRFTRTRLNHLRADSLPLLVLARLRPGVSPEQAAATLGSVSGPQASTRRTWTVPIRSLFGPHGTGAFELDHRSLGTSLGVISGLVWLCGLVSLAGMAIAGFGRRRSDFAVRLALGASRGQLARSLAGELGVLLLGGMALGTLVAAVAMRVVLQLDMPDTLRADLSVASLPVVAWGTLVAFVTVALACAAPVVALLRLKTSSALFGEWSGVRRHRYRSALLSATVAGATILVLLAVISMSTVRESFSDARGFSADEVLFLDVRTRTSIGESDELWQEYARHQLIAARALTASLAAIPGVDAVALGRPHVNKDYQRQFATERTVGTITGDVSVRCVVASVGDGYVGAMGLNIVGGRDFLSSEEGAVIVSRSLATTLMPGGNIVGTVVRLGGPLQVVGVFEDVAFGSASNGPVPAAVIQRPVNRMTEGTTLAWVIRSNRPAAIRSQVRDLAEQHLPRAVDYSVLTADEATGLDVADMRLGSYVFVVYAMVTLVVAASGVWLLVAMAIDSQRRVLGIRFALGASARQLRFSLLAGAFLPVVIGLIGGSAGAVLVHRLLGAWLYVPVLSSLPWYLAGVLIVLVASILAAWFGSQRVLTMPVGELFRS